jgi:hypothetical protein
MKKLNSLIGERNTMKKKREREGKMLRELQQHDLGLVACCWPWTI